MTQPVASPVTGLFGANDPFIEFLCARRQKVFYLRPYLGNSGDELIYMGADHLLAKLGIKTTVDPRLAEVILWPGGNPTMWSNNIEGWRAVWRQFPATEFVLAPATFQTGLLDWASTLRRDGGSITGLFARDVQSHQNLLQAGLPPGITIGISHDPALSLYDSNWMAEHRAAATSEYALCAFREDHEARVSTSTGLLKKCLPLWAGRRIAWHRERKIRTQVLQEITQTLLPGTRVVEWDVSLANFHCYVEGVRRASVLHTNRLHALLLAAMLHKPVVIHPTSYGKLEAVCEHSLKNWASVSNFQ